MKAVRVHRFGGPEVLQLDDVPVPTPGPGQVLLRNRAVGVNPVDTYIRAGNYGLLPPLPYIPGTDAAGVVEVVGEGVTRVAPGDRAYSIRTATAMSGGYAEFVLCPAPLVQTLPDAASFAQGAAVGVPYGTAYRGLHHKAGARPGETVLVHGASGGVGIAAVQLAVAHGLTVIGTAGTERGRQLVREQGAHHVLDHGTADYLKRVTELTGGRGPDVIIEMLASTNLQKDLEVAAPFGRIVIIGSRGPIQVDPRATMTKDLVVTGLTLRSASEAEMMSMHAAIRAGLAAGTLRPVVGQEFPLAEAARAHEAVLRSGAYGKIVLIP